MDDIGKIAEIGPQEQVLSGYIEPRELCRQLHKTARTLLRWHQRGLGPPRIRIGRMILYKVELVREWIEQHAEGRGGAKRKGIPPPSAKRS